MLERLKAEILEDLEHSCDVLSEGITERRLCLQFGPNIELRPEFMHKYNRRSPEIYHNRDKRADLRLDTTEEKEELTPEAKEAIHQLQKKLKKELATSLEALDNSLDRQFSTNELFFNLSSIDRASILESHKRDRSNLERRLRSNNSREIEKVRNSPYSTVTQKRNVLTAEERTMKEKRDREELQFYIGLVAEEKTLLREFETYAASITQEDGITADDLQTFRDEHVKEVMKTLDEKKRIFLLDRERVDRMNEAKWIEMFQEVDIEARAKLLSSYSQRMDGCNLQLVSSVNWDRALRDIYSTFTQSLNNWEQFVEIAVHYWCCLAMPRRRAKWNRIISRYATLFVSQVEIIREVDIPFNAMVKELRTRRDTLLREILNLDEKIRSHYMVTKRTIRSSPLVTKQTGELMKRDYSPHDDVYVFIQPDVETNKNRSGRKGIVVWAGGNDFSTIQ